MNFDFYALAIYEHPYPDLASQSLTNYGKLEKFNF